MLSVEPDMYSPNMDEFGNYVDYVPSSSHFNNGLRCPCGTRRDSVAHSTPAKFTQHIKTKTHVKWLESLNNNKQNYMIENEKQKEIIHQQQQLVIQLSQDIQKQRNIIYGLTQQVTSLTKQIQDMMEMLNENHLSKKNVDLIHLLD